jgi:RNA polymerase subunit RPABC4/transcription elongation factor Spt4
MKRPPAVAVVCEDCGRRYLTRADPPICPYCRGKKAMEARREHHEK